MECKDGQIEIKNSNNDSINTITIMSNNMETYTLPDETIEVYVNGVLEETFTMTIYSPLDILITNI